MEEEQQQQEEQQGRLLAFDTLPPTVHCMELCIDVPRHIGPGTLPLSALGARAAVHSWQRMSSRVCARMCRACCLSVLSVLVPLLLTPAAVHRWRDGGGAAASGGP
jgi:hypothetical protein